MCGIFGRSYIVADSRSELHSGRLELHSGLPARPIIIGTLEEGYFHWPPILLHSLPMDTDAIIRLLCGIFLDGFAGQTSFHRNGSTVGYYSGSATLPRGYFSAQCSRNEFYRFWALSLWPSANTSIVSDNRQWAHWTCQSQILTSIQLDWHHPAHDLSINSRLYCLNSAHTNSLALICGRHTWGALGHFGTMWMSVLPLIAATCRHSGTAGVGGTGTSQSLRHSGRLPTLVPGHTNCHSGRHTSPTPTDWPTLHCTCSRPL